MLAKNTFFIICGFSHCAFQRIQNFLEQNPPRNKDKSNPQLIEFIKAKKAQMPFLSGLKERVEKLQRTLKQYLPHNYLIIDDLFAQRQTNYLSEQL